MSDFDPIKVFPTTNELVQFTAHRIVNIANAVLQVNDTFSLALSGGSTPKPVYERLAQEYGTFLDWSRIHLWWGDERAVPPDDEQSNYAMVKAALLDHIDIPDENVHRIQGENDPTDAATAYVEEIAAFFTAPEMGLFDLNLLGMGDDGHTASLFPHTEAVHEHDKLVVAHFVEAHDMYRITLTPKAILESANIMFLVAGANKVDALYEVLEGDENTNEYPSQVIARSNHEHVTWVLDEAAAERLNR